jgi:hypothetical protein
MDAATWGLVGTLIGASASILTTVLTNFTSLNIWKNTKRQEREERARAFQRETLLELQVQMRDYVRSNYLAFQYDMKVYNETGEWLGKNIPADLDNKLLDLNSTTSLLIQRVSNDDLRLKLEELKETVTKLMLSETQIIHERFNSKISVPYENLQKDIGKILRDLY